MKQTLQPTHSTSTWNASTRETISHSNRPVSYHPLIGRNRPSPPPPPNQVNSRPYVSLNGHTKVWEEIGPTPDRVLAAYFACRYDFFFTPVNYCWRHYKQSIAVASAWSDRTKRQSRLAVLHVNLRRRAMFWQRTSHASPVLQCPSLRWTIGHSRLGKNYFQYVHLSHWVVG